MSEPLHAHACGCVCTQCRAMAAAIAAEKPDGSAFYTDKELVELSELGNERCMCEECEALRREGGYT
jgi:hypothetical protein